MSNNKVINMQELWDFSDSDSEYGPNLPFVVEHPTFLIGFNLCEGEKIKLHLLKMDQCEGHKSMPLSTPCCDEFAITNTTRVILIPMPGRYLLRDCTGNSDAQIFKQPAGGEWLYSDFFGCCSQECK